MPNLTYAEKMVPQNIEAEQAVLGALLIDPACIVVVEPQVQPCDFYLEKHAAIYAAILAVHHSAMPVDFLTVTSELETRGKLQEVGGAAYLTSLLNATPTSVHASHYAQLMAKPATGRKLMAAAGEIAGIYYECPDDEDMMKAKAWEALARACKGGRTRFRSAAEVGHAMERQIKERFDEPCLTSGMQTGFRALDRALSGLEAGELMIIAGRPGSGKSSLALGIALNVAKRGEGVAYFSLEMDSELLQRRAACVLGGYQFKELKTGFRERASGMGRWTDEEQVRFWEIWLDLERMPLYWHDASNITTAAATADAAELAEKDGVSLIVFDYLGLAGDSNHRNDRVQQVGEISRGLKQMARSVRVPVIALAQLNRKCEERADKKPVLPDLRDSGEIEQDADHVLFIWRPKMYWKTEQEWQVAFPRAEWLGDQAQIIAAKVRNGEPGHVMMHFEDKYMRFMDVVKEPQGMGRG